MQELLQKADSEFVKQANDRMELGAEKYGPVKFLAVDTLEEGMQELLDLSNYARMTFIKIYILKQYLDKLTAEHPAVNKEGFVPMKEFLQQ
jgi:hypothetical protein